MSKKICVIEGDQTRTAESYFFCEARPTNFIVWCENIDLGTVCDALTSACKSGGIGLLRIVGALIYAWCTEQRRYERE